MFDFGSGQAGPGRLPSSTPSLARVSPGTSVSATKSTRSGCNSIRKLTLARRWQGAGRCRVWLAGLVLRSAVCPLGYSTGADGAGRRCLARDGRAAASELARRPWVSDTRATPARSAAGSPAVGRRRRRSQRAWEPGRNAARGPLPALQKRARRPRHATGVAGAHGRAARGPRDRSGPTPSTPRVATQDLVLVPGAAEGERFLQGRGRGTGPVGRDADVIASVEPAAGRIPGRGAGRLRRWDPHGTPTVRAVFYGDPRRGACCTSQPGARLGGRGVHSAQPAQSRPTADAL